MIELLALRFRDLAGPTIDEHRAVIDQHGYVWWGWWSKPFEQVPRDVFAHFADEIAAHGEVEWLLVDSGNDEVYRAHVAEIHYSPSSAPEGSPDVHRTPAYYSRQEYRAWFRITGIEDATEEDLTANSYEEPAPSTFDDDPHRLAFNGKRVFSIKELLSRHRTIYFLRKARTGDPSHLASLAPSDPVSAFMTRTLERPSHYVVQVSDPHFGERHAFARTSDEVHRNLALQITDDLEALYPGIPPAAVILSGDFTWQGKPDEFDWAREFVSDLRSVLGLEPFQFLPCPGNHDIQWAAETIGYDPSAVVAAAPQSAQANYLQFAKQAVGLELAPGKLALGRRLLLSNGVALDILALNSSQLEQKDFAGYGFISSTQLKEAVAAMNWKPDNKGARYRVIVLHHHVVPVVSVETIARTDARYSLTLDAGELLYRALELNVDLVVHGHMHQPFAAIYGRVGAGQLPSSRRVAIQAAGSAGVEAKHVPSGVGRNSYLIYELHPDRVVVRERTTSPNVDGFGDGGQHKLDRSEEGLQ